MGTGNPPPKADPVLESLIGRGGMAVVNTVSDAWHMFGSGDDDDTDDGPSGDDDGAEGSGPPPDTDSMGPASDAEAQAAKDLATKTDTLKSLDNQLRGVAAQITIDNSVSKKRLSDLSDKIEAELSYLKNSPGDSVVKNEAVTTFLAGVSGEVVQVLTDAAADVDASRASMNNVGGGYNDVGGGADTGTQGAVGPATPAAPAAPADPGYEPADPGAAPPVGSQQPGSGPDNSAGQNTGWQDALGPAASALPQALGGLGGLGGGLPGGDLGSTLGELIGQGGDRRDHDSDHDNDSDSHDSKDHDGDNVGKNGDDHSGDNNGKTNPADQNGADGSKPAGQVTPSGATGGGTPPVPPTPAPTMVTLPDGTPATAGNSAVAAAARAHLSGADLTDAYKAAGITLPPPGTVLKDTIALSAAGVGDLAMFKDKWVMLLGDNKVYVDGQEQPASVLGKMPGFMGFTHPPASIMPTAPAAPAPAAAPSTQQVAAVAQT